MVFPISATARGGRVIARIGLFLFLLPILVYVDCVSEGDGGPLSSYDLSATVSSSFLGSVGGQYSMPAESYIPEDTVIDSSQGLSSTSEEPVVVASPPRKERKSVKFQEGTQFHERTPEQQSQLKQQFFGFRPRQQRPVANQMLRVATNNNEADISSSSSTFEWEDNGASNGTGFDDIFRTDDYDGTNPNGDDEYYRNIDWYIRTVITLCKVAIVFSGAAYMLGPRLASILMSHRT